MSSNVGLSTPRGSGTSGYVQRNLSLLKPRAAGIGAPYSPSDANGTYRPPVTRKPDAAILNHDRMREIEIQVLALRDRLEEEDEEKEKEGKEELLGEEEIDERCESLRTKLVKELEDGAKNGKGVGGAGQMKRYAVHEMAEAKIKETERLRRALGLRGDEVGGDDGGVMGGDKGAGNEHPMARQERRKREREEERLRRELEGEKGDGFEGAEKRRDGEDRRERYHR